MEKLKCIDKATLSGTMGEITFSHEVFGHKVYIGMLSVRRMSGAVDVLPVQIPEVNYTEDLVNSYVTVMGSVRSFNEHIGDKSKLNVYVLATYIQVSEPQEHDTNEVVLHGFMCGKKEIRTTPAGRIIINFSIAINTNYGKSFYIPTIVWGLDASRVENYYENGFLIRTKGRLQSREYTNSKGVDGVAIEYSAFEIMGK